MREGNQIVSSESNTDWSVYYIDEDTKRTKMENGYKSDFLNCDNSVTNTKELNCKICNHKLDPIYIKKLYDHYDGNNNNNVTTTTKRKGDDDDETNKAKQGFRTIIVNGCVKTIRNEESDDNETKSTVEENTDEHTELLIQRHVDGKATSPSHETIWPGRNKWQVKERLQRLFDLISIDTVKSWTFSCPTMREMICREISTIYIIDSP